MSELAEGLQEYSGWRALASREQSAAQDIKTYVDELLREEPIEIKRFAWRALEFGLKRREAAEQEALALNQSFLLTERVIDEAA